MGNAGIKASVCIAAYGKPSYLVKTLESIYRQIPPFKFEVIVCDDGSPTDDIRTICTAGLGKCWKPEWRYLRIEREPVYRNPSFARNVTYRAASGEVIIAESDDTIHTSAYSIEKLVAELVPGTFVIANVFNTDFNGVVVPGNLENPNYSPLTVYTGPTNKRPFFFLGSIFRRDLYAVGGNDEDFVAPGREDEWFAECLMHGLGLRPVYSTTIVGYHLQHKHLGGKDSYPLYHQKHNAAMKGSIPWCSAGGPWVYDP